MVISVLIGSIFPEDIEWSEEMRRDGFIGVAELRFERCKSGFDSSNGFIESCRALLFVQRLLNSLRGGCLQFRTQLRDMVGDRLLKLPLLLRRKY